MAGWYITISILFAIVNVFVCPIALFFFAGHGKSVKDLTFENFCSIGIVGISLGIALGFAWPFEIVGVPLTVGLYGLFRVIRSESLAGSIDRLLNKP